MSWALQRAVRQGHLAKVQDLWRGEEVALLHAAEAGQLAVVDWLLSQKVPLNARDDDGHTPLMLAAIYGHATVAVALVEAGAAYHAVNRDGETAMDLARFHDEYKVVEQFEKSHTLQVDAVYRAIEPRLGRDVARLCSAYVPFAAVREPRWHFFD